MNNKVAVFRKSILMQLTGCIILNGMMQRMMLYLANAIIRIITVIIMNWK